MDYSNIDIYLRLTGQSFLVEKLPLIMQGNVGVNSIILRADLDNQDGTDSSMAYLPKISFFDELGQEIKSYVPLEFKRYVMDSEPPYNEYRARIPKGVTQRAGMIKARFTLFVPVPADEFDPEDLVNDDGSAWVSGNTAYVLSNINAFDFYITESGGGRGYRPTF